MTLLEVTEITKDFKGLRALHRIDLAIHQGEIFGLIGPNGSGKTTLFNIITGFLHPTVGQVLFKGGPITGLKPNQIVGLGIGRVFQLSSFFSNLSAKENIVVARHLRTANNIFGSLINTRAYRQEEAKLEQKAVELLAFIGLAERRDTVARNLPYGEQRELELAMALAAEPELLLLDEPATGMNPEETARFMDLIRQLQQSGITILVVEHNMRVVMGLCTRIAVIDFGVKIAEGTAKEITSNDKVISVYLGSGQSDVEGR